ncbi:MAG: ribonuclease P protein component [Alphaproteobacteria bacterium]|nr:ribonuclease P protein component [Alphaproteobacteria bacterium]
MGFGREWRPSRAGGFWRRAAPRVASVCPPEKVVGGSQRARGPRFETLKLRADFLRVASSGRRCAAPTLVVQAGAHSGGPDSPSQIRAGFTASRKIGNAVVRNRAKRRMRAAAAEMLPKHGRPGRDYVLIARSGTANRPFSELLADLERALRRLGRDDPRPPTVTRACL